MIPLPDAAICHIAKESIINENRAEEQVSILELILFEGYIL